MAVSAARQNRPISWLVVRFSAAGRRRAYYHDNREDALIMWRTAPERATA